jgi:hypothetical protein
MAADTPGSHDATDDILENNLRSEQASRRRDDMDVLRKIMHDPKGRCWLYRLMEKCNVMGQTFFGEETHKSAFAQGQENIGKQLFLEVTDASLDLYVRMIKEAKAEDERQAKELKRRNDKAEGKNEPPLTPDAQMPFLNPPEGWPGHMADSPPPAIQS